jgi:peptidoglycan/xylan/chitin deacetylase (PgdA/CDA1 family)
MHDQVLRLPYWYGSAGLTLVLVVLVSLVVLAPYRTAAPPVPAHAVRAAQTPPPARTVSKPVSAELVRHTARADRVVAFTFDDGPAPEYTPQVLALLARYRAVATFCMIGSEAVRHPGLVRQVVAAGMRLGSHTVSHDQHLRDRPEPQIEAEIVNGRADIQAAAGWEVPVEYFRAPAGRWSDSMRHIAARHGMKPLSWSVDPRDWSRPGMAWIVTTVRHQAKPGALIVMHDGGGRRDQTVAALAELLPWFVAEGYQFDVPG